MTPTTLHLVVPADAEGVRLDRWLAGAVEGVTRSSLRRWIEDGRIDIDGAPPAKAGVLLRGGMTIVVTPPEPEPPRPQPESIPLTVVHEDDDLLVVDKAAAMVVHPGHGVRTGTLVHALLGRGTPLAPAGGAERPGIVHRLDRGTSGLLVVAKTDLAHRALARAFAERRVAKRYVAIVWGHPTPQAGRVDRSIGRSRSNPTRMATRGLRGRSRPAVTIYSTRERLPGFSVLDITLETGRTHQIRVHMQSLHHPIVGDDRYGGRPWRGMQDPIKRKAVRLFDRLALHAAHLGFDHPRHGTPLHFDAPVPPELEALRATLSAP